MGDLETQIRALEKDIARLIQDRSEKEREGVEWRRKALIIEEKYKVDVKELKNQIDMMKANSLVRAQ